ncbi:MAG TPA: sugar ABC transporter ATP-binding protein [Feifaniaceae bacterium]|nr:sugar ABC transporter ATP-binding protein [Feifaniaceae bacterium]
MEQRILLEMKGVTKSFGATKALKNVSIDLMEREILAICGENGAGKSTLMKVLSGTYEHSAYEGEILVGGKKCMFRAPADSSAAGIEMIHQEISVHLDLSVAENIFLGRVPTKNGIVRWAAMREEAQKYAAMVGLRVPVGTHLRDLSASQCQMVSIARALSRNPRILVLDEPTSPLTEAEAEELFKILFRLREQGISCIYISHKIREIKRLADRVCILRDGSHVWTKPASEVGVDDIVEAMVNRKIENMYPKESVPIGREALCVKNLRVRHPYNKKKYIVDGVNITVHEGEILGLVGLVGSGRSETVNAIFGAIEGAYDEMRIGGKPARIKDPGDAIRKGLALLSEDRKISGFIPTLDIAENISLPRLDKVSQTGIVKRDAEKKYGETYMKALNIKANSERDMVTGLSGGNQQKVVLSKWLMADPRVLLLDEPTRGIDVGAKTQIYQIMTQLVRQGMAIVMISSELPELVGMCDRYLLLANGKIRAELTREEADEELFLRICSGA